MAETARPQGGSGGGKRRGGGGSAGRMGGGAGRGYPPGGGAGGGGRFRSARKRDGVHFGRGRRFEAKEAKVWTPKTKLGRMVVKGEINSMDDAIKSGLEIKEPEIADRLIPNLREEVLDVKRVQRVTVNGRVMRFRVVVAVGDGNGYIGLGEGKSKESGAAIRSAVERAKLDIKKIKKGCSSWFCTCGGEHTVPQKTTGKCGSVSITLMPASRGLGLVCGETPKKILNLVGVKDVHTSTEGHTRTTINLAHATVNALVNASSIKGK